MKVVIMLLLLFNFIKNDEITTIDDFVNEITEKGYYIVLFQIYCLFGPDVAIECCEQELNSEYCDDFVLEYFSPYSCPREKRYDRKLPFEDKLKLIEIGAMENKNLKRNFTIRQIQILLSKFKRKIIYHYEVKKNLKPKIPY